jgi:thioredoxin-like negative regulator of GroEL
VCGALQPKVVRFLEDYPEVASAEVVLENVPAIAGELLVMSAPSVLIFCDGKELHRIMQYVSIYELKAIFDRLGIKK